MDKIHKFLKRLSAKEKKWAEEAITAILNHDLGKYDLKKMRGYANLYRVRVGQIRIIFLDGENDAQILHIERRNDNTYKQF